MKKLLTIAALAALSATLSGCWWGPPPGGGGGGDHHGGGPGGGGGDGFHGAIVIPSNTAQG